MQKAVEDALELRHELHLVDEDVMLSQADPPAHVLVAGIRVAQRLVPSVVELEYLF